MGSAVDRGETTQQAKSLVTAQWPYGAIAAELTALHCKSLSTYLYYLQYIGVVFVVGLIGVENQAQVTLDRPLAGGGLLDRSSCYPSS